MPTVEEKDLQEEIRQQIYENSVPGFSYIFMNVMATIVASYGLIADSTAVVIGAMLIAMLLGPITGIALGLIDGNNQLLKTAFFGELIGVFFVLLTAYTIGLIHSDIPLGKEIASRTSPNILDLIIALAGGAAGAYATVKPKISSGLIGVAISTALVPPLSTCAILMARGEYQLGFGGFLLFFANFVAIQFASSVVLWIAGFHKIDRIIKFDNERRKDFLFRAGVSFLVLTVLAVILGYNFLQYSHQKSFENEVRKELKETVNQFPGSQIAEVRFSRNDSKNLITVYLRTPFSVSAGQVADIESKLPKLNNLENELRIRSIITTETTKDGIVKPKDEISEVIK